MDQEVPGALRYFPSLSTHLPLLSTSFTSVEYLLRLVCKVGVYYITYWYITITKRASFTLRFILGEEHSMGFDKCTECPVPPPLRYHAEGFHWPKHALCSTCSSLPRSVRLFMWLGLSLTSSCLFSGYPCSLLFLFSMPCFVFTGFLNSVLYLLLAY